MIYFIQVVLYNRKDCCSERLNNFIITVGSDATGVSNPVCVADGGDVSKTMEIVNNCVPPLNGQYVHVKLKGQQRTLTICEIEVFESEGEQKNDCND